jgi:hypothetical protein
VIGATVVLIGELAVGVTVTVLCRTVVIVTIDKPHPEPILENSSEPDPAPATELLPWPLFKPIVDALWETGMMVNVRVTVEVIVVVGVNSSEESLTTAAWDPAGVGTIVTVTQSVYYISAVFILHDI